MVATGADARVRVDKANRRADGIPTVAWRLRTEPFKSLSGMLLSGWPELNRRAPHPQFCPGHFHSDTGRDNS